MAKNSSGLELKFLSLISYLSTQIDLIQYFGSSLAFFIKIMHILQTKLNSQEINSIKLHESLMLHISYKRPNT